MSDAEGCVHGRFQPFHNGHYEYVEAASSRCDFLWVGITQPEVTRLVGDSSQPLHRYNAADNPLSYWERLSVVSAVLRGLRPVDSYAVVPFPIETPEVLRNYVPQTSVAYTTIYDDWNRQKVDVLRAQGYRVEVLWERTTKLVAGSQVRGFLHAGDETWRTLVPPEASRKLDELSVPARLRTA